MSDNKIDESKRVEIAKLHAEGWSQRKIAEKLNLAQSTVHKYKHKAELKDGAFPPPDGHYTKATSTLYDAEGALKLQWVKSNVDEERRLAAEKAAFEALCEKLPREPPISAPNHTVASLANFYVFTDCHIGALCWDKEGGDDWDVRIAEKTLKDTFDAMIRNSPRAGTAIIGQMGDLLHTDGLIPVTPAHHNVLDADSRFSKIVATAIRVLRHIISTALSHHDKVHVIMADANHDPSSQVWLRHTFAALYENEPRITVNTSELPYYAHIHGQNMICVHHGHMVKNDSLPLLLATLYPKMWGATTKRYVHVGHRHHTDEKEMNGMKVIQHPTMAAKDAYAARGGWLSQRQASSITYHAEYGEVARTIITPEMLA